MYIKQVQFLPSRKHIICNKIHLGSFSRAAEKSNMHQNEADPTRLSFSLFCSFIAAITFLSCFTFIPWLTLPSSEQRIFYYLSLCVLIVCVTYFYLQVPQLPLRQPPPSPYRHALFGASSHSLRKKGLVPKACPPRALTPFFPSFSRPGSASYCINFRTGVAFYFGAILSYCELIFPAVLRGM